MTHASFLARTCPTSKKICNHVSVIHPHLLSPTPPSICNRCGALHTSSDALGLAVSSRRSYSFPHQLRLSTSRWYVSQPSHCTYTVPRTSAFGFTFFAFLVPHTSHVNSTVTVLRVERSSFDGAPASLPWNASPPPDVPLARQRCSFAFLRLHATCTSPRDDDACVEPCEALRVERRDRSTRVRAARAFIASTGEVGRRADVVAATHVAKRAMEKETATSRTKRAGSSSRDGVAASGDGRVLGHVAVHVRVDASAELLPRGSSSC
mmetsp:Transcript_6901/g.42111  ORF Transcript_6901/g.42111 Transcript_6901/m.42111 type:complete len:265 (+) Transcript_6901:961-1755(+)